MKRKVVLGVAAVALGALLAVGGTLAWFTDTETVTNVITTGKVDIKLTESEPGTPNGGSVAANNQGGYTYTGITPGAVLDKKPEVALETGSNDAWVRVQVEATSTGGDMSNLVYKLGEDVVTPVKTEDGKFYFYCKDELSLNGTSTYVPFDKVEFPGDKFGNEFANATVDIKLTAEAIQSDNLGAENVESAFAGQTITPLETTSNATGA